MTEITRCNRVGFHYNGFLNVLDNSNPAYNAKSSIKIFKKIYFCSNCGTWVNSKIHTPYNYGRQSGKNHIHGFKILHRDIIIFYCLKFR